MDRVDFWYECCLGSGYATERDLAINFHLQRNVDMSKMVVFVYGHGRLLRHLLGSTIICIHIPKTVTKVGRG